MSRTDKTVPYRVRNAYEGPEHHNHRDGVCDLPTRDEVASHVYGYSWLTHYRGHCGYELLESHYDVLVTYFPRPASNKTYRAKDQGRLRTTERRAARTALKTARAGEELDDVEFGDGRHRHNALWEAW